MREMCKLVADDMEENDRSEGTIWMDDKIIADYGFTVV